MDKLLKEAKKLNIKITDKMTEKEIKNLIEEKKREIAKQNNEAVIIDSMMNNMMM